MLNVHIFSFLFSVVARGDRKAILMLSGFPTSIPIPCSCFFCVCAFHVLPLVDVSQLSSVAFLSIFGLILHLAPFTPLWSQTRSTFTVYQCSLTRVAQCGVVTHCVSIDREHHCSPVVLTLIPYYTLILYLQCKSLY